MASPVRRAAGSALGLGLLPIAPGTWGSLGTAVVLGLVLGVDGVWDGPVDTAGLSPLALWGGLLGLSAVLFAVGVKVGNFAPVDWGRHDPGPFVLDEVVGQLLAVAPLLPGPLDGVGLAVAFFAFRLFDVWKPKPCRRLEALPGGLGIMADDVMAGVYALVVVALARAAGLTG